VLNNCCFSINTLFELDNLIKLKINRKKILILFIKNYLVTGFGVEWLNTFIKLVNKKYSQYNIKFFVDAGNDYGLSLLILRENIDYLKLRSNKIILEKVNQIAKKNKVVLNPTFNVVDLSKIKNYKNLKI
tara:strand:+ start:1134 stop:1523 length:390 start_codon:yes stop_codon:yes gene_type:complete